jgi:DNA-binding FrmR family transcriptional regulator
MVSCLLPLQGIQVKKKEPAVKHDSAAALRARLSRIEGQVRGVTRMIDEGRYCIDVLTQLRAVRAALLKVESQMLKDHLNHCIEDAIVSGNATEQRRKAGELIELLERT